MRDKRINLRLTKEEYETLLKMAEKDRRKVTTFITLILQDYIKEKDKR